MAQKGRGGNAGKGKGGAKGGGPGRTGGGPPGAKPPVPAPVPDEPESIGDIVDRALERADQEGVAEAPKPAGGRAVTEQDLREAAALYQAAAAKAAEREAAADRRVASAEERESQLDVREVAVIERERQAAAIDSETAAKRAEIEAREKQLAAAEEASFHREVEIARRETEVLATVYEQARAEVLGPLLEARAKVVADEQGKIEELMTVLSSRADELDRRDLALRERAREVSLEQQLLQDQRAEWEDERAAADAADARARHHELARERRRSQQLESEVRALSDTKDRLDAIERYVGSDPSVVLAEIEALRSRVADLTAELAARPHTTVAAALAAAEDRAHRLESDLRRVLGENESIKASLQAADMAILERDRATQERDTARAEVSSKDLQIETLQREINKLTKRTTGKVPFRECTAMDESASLQSRAPDVRNEPIKLDQLVADLQSTLAYYPEDNGRGLRFHLDDLRLFIGGMAMSRLHILEGVSGTGKTSLPIAVARALGGMSSKIEVQAGWRDNRDLLGYYNEFEQQFREHECTKALYRALMPRYRDGVYFVILDEMNLSKPEQYFADFLSILEDKEGADRRQSGVSISDNTLDAAPLRLERAEQGGMRLPLGPNVWFIGTANHDETTASFAPKTQSRSHVMVLPRRAPDLSTIPRRNVNLGGTIRHEQLMGLFDTAAREHARHSEAAKDFLTSTLQVLEDFDTDLSWGERINRQLERFVPAVIASGGTLGLAVDHMLMTKLVHRLRDGFSPDIRKARPVLLQHINEYWPCPAIPVSVSKTVRELERQIRTS